MNPETLNHPAPKARLLGRKPLVRAVHAPLQPAARRLAGRHGQPALQARARGVHALALPRLHQRLISFQKGSELHFWFDLASIFGRIAPQNAKETRSGARAWRAL